MTTPRECESDHTQPDRGSRRRWRPRMHVVFLVIAIIVAAAIAAHQRVRSFHDLPPGVQRDAAALRQDLHTRSAWLPPHFPKRIREEIHVYGGIPAAP